MVKQPSFVLTYLPQKHSFPLAELSDFIDSAEINLEFILVTYSDLPLTPHEYNNVKSMEFDKAIHYIFNN